MIMDMRGKKVFAAQAYRLIDGTVALDLMNGTYPAPPYPSEDAACAGVQLAAMDADLGDWIMQIAPSVEGRPDFRIGKPK